MKVSNFFNYPVNTIHNLYTKNGYKFFDSGNFDVNFGAIRSSEIEPNKFNDWGFLIFRDQYSEFVIKFFRMTTDPGLIALKNPINNLGTAIVMPGQYRGVFQRGKHKGRNAWIQCSNFTVARDRNNNGTPDYNNIMTAGANCGINFHNAPVKNVEAIKFVGKFSYACQVVPDIKEFDYIDSILLRSSKLYGGKISYTLLEEKCFNSQ